MRHILVYADSLTWGIVPNTRNRLPFEERWPGVLEDKLHQLGRPVRIVEDCLNGRRTVWDDPFKPGRNGLLGLAQRVESHSPLSLVILMLGTNDFQFSHPFNNAWSAAQGIAILIDAIRRAPIEPGMPVPPILVVCPPPIHSPQGVIAAKFAGAENAVWDWRTSIAPYAPRWTAVSSTQPVSPPQAESMGFTWTGISIFRSVWHWRIRSPPSWNPVAWRVRAFDDAIPA
jgi:lysophospholipase L1-like esterase